MDREEVSPSQPKPRWFIDLNWLQQNRRSLSALVKGYLCAKCRQRQNAEGGEISGDELLVTIKDCCASEPGYITSQLPILESVFRFFLAKGNPPLTLKELGEQLSKQRGGDPYRTSEEILSRLLKSDDYYGLSQAPESG